MSRYLLDAILGTTVYAKPWSDLIDLVVIRPEAALRKDKIVKTSISFAYLMCCFVSCANANENDILKDQNGCKIINPSPSKTYKESITWSGGCKDGWINGYGFLAWYKDGKKDDVNEKGFVNGILAEYYLGKKGSSITGHRFLNTRRDDKPYDYDVSFTDRKFVTDGPSDSGLNAKYAIENNPSAEVDEYEKHWGKSVKLAEIRYLYNAELIAKFIGIIDVDFEFTRGIAYSAPNWTLIPPQTGQ